MKVLIVGKGSIGQRHADSLKRQGATVQFVSRRAGGDFYSLDQAFENAKPDVVWICNETAEHLTSLENLDRLAFTGPVFIEKPVFKNSIPPQLKNVSTKNIFVTYNLRLLPSVQELKRRFQKEKVISAIFYVGQRLTQWRPSREVGQTYSAHSDQGGGVLRDLSHEFDLINYLLGPMTARAALGGNYGVLGIQAEEAYSVLFETQNCAQGVLQLNYLDQTPRRFLLVHTEKNSYHLDFIAGELRENTTMVGEVTKVITTYDLQAQKLVRRDFSELCTFEEGLAVMQQIENVERGPHGSVL